MQRMVMFLFDNFKIFNLCRLCPNLMLNAAVSNALPRYAGNVVPPVIFWSIMHCFGSINLAFGMRSVFKIHICYFFTHIGEIFRVSQLDNFQYTLKSFCCIIAV